MNEKKKNIAIRGEKPSCTQTRHIAISEILPGQEKKVGAFMYTAFEFSNISTQISQKQNKHCSTVALIDCRENMNHIEQ